MYTLLVTTFNRTAFLERLCCYYTTKGFRHPVVVADASADEHVASVVASVDRAREAGLQITYRRFPNHYADVQCLADVLEGLTTPLFSWLADDDFLIPEALEGAAAFLAANPNYAAATGRGATFSTEAHAAIGRVRAVNAYGQPHRPEAKAAERVCAHGLAYRPTTFTLRRREHALAHYRFLAEHELYNNKTNRFGGFFGEFIDSAATVARGPVHRMNQLMMARQAHLNMTSASANSHFDVFDWVSDSRWAGQCVLAVDYLTSIIVDTDGGDAVAARVSAKRAVWAYTAHILGSRLQAATGRKQPVSSRLRNGLVRRLEAFRLQRDPRFAEVKAIIEGAPSS